MRPECLPERSIILLAVLLSGIVAALAHAEEPKLIIASSERMRPVLTALAERFEDQRPGINFEFTGGGSGRAVSALLDGTAHLGAISRPVTDDELDRVRRMTGRDLLAFPIGLDAVAVYVRPDNPLTALSLEQVSGILWLSIPTWEDLGIDPKGTALHQHGPECEHDPNRKIPIELHLPEDELGALAVLRARSMGGAELPRMLKRHRRNESIFDSVRADANALALAGWGETSGIRTLPLRHNSDTVRAPSTSTIGDRSYPLTHYVYLLSIGPPEGTSREFLLLALSVEGQVAVAAAGGAIVALPPIAK